MSRYIQILNKIKSNIGNLALTPSQISCQMWIEERILYPGVVNLYGLHGTGKTALGWALATAGKVSYVIHPSKMNVGVFSKSNALFLDNANADRSSFRRVLGELESLGIEKAIIATHRPVDDYIVRTELKLSERDIEIVRENLLVLGYSSSEGGWKNLWHGLIQTARVDQ